MSHRTRTLTGVSAATALAGGVAVLVGTYVVPWCSLTGRTTQLNSYGGVTLYQLRTFGGGWYAVASLVMTFGAVVLLASGISATVTADGRPWELGCAVGFLVGSGTALCAAFATGFPHGFSVEPLYVTPDAGEWVCVLGAVLGLGACVVSTVSGLRINVRGVSEEVHAPLTHAG
jgi:hypothetical protein